MKIFVILMLGFSLASLTTFGQGTWVRKADFPDGRAEVVSFTIDSFSYVGLGASTNSSLIWRYTPKIDKWERFSTYPGSFRRSAFCFVINNKAYIGGGMTAYDDFDRSFWEFDPSTNQWTRKLDPPFFVLEDYSVAFSIGEFGFLSKAITPGWADFVKYDPAQDRWTNLPGYPGKGSLHKLGFALNGKVYLGLGFGGVSLVEDFWEYDPTVNLWSRKKDFPGLSRRYGSSFSIGNRGYIGAGWNKPSYGDLKDFWEYDPNSDSWVQIADCPSPTILGCAFSNGGKGYFGIGLFAGQEIWEYTPSVTSVHPIEKQYGDVVLYPNPVNSSVFIKYPNIPVHRIRVFSSDGNLILEREDCPEKIDLSKKPAGVYYLVVEGEWDVISKAFIKE